MPSKICFNWDFLILLKKKTPSPIQTHIHIYKRTLFTRLCCWCYVPVRHAANVRAYVCMYVCIFYAKTIKVIREKLKKKKYLQQMPKTAKREL